MITLLLVLIAVVILSVLIIVKLSKKISKLKTENKQLANEYQIVYKQLKQAEKLKEEIHTGDNNIDFNNSVDILSELSKRGC